MPGGDHDLTPATQGDPELEGIRPCEPEGLRVGAVLGRYRVVRALGEGGMGAVYEALHDDIGRRVAIKVLQPALAQKDSARSRFFREARAASRVRHPGVVQVHDVDVDVDGHTVYLVMDLVDGESLAQRLARGPLDADELVATMMPAIEGLAAAHDAGVIHRDLKPANVLLAATPEGPRARIADFGVSRILDEESELTGSMAVLGTPAYMSPEQARGAKRVGAESDQFSLGAVLYACLTGRRPFEGESPLEVAWNIQRNDRPPLARAAPDAPPALAAVIERALSPDAADRFASVRALADALRAAHASPRAVAPPPRRGLALALAAVVALVAAATLAPRSTASPTETLAPQRVVTTLPAAPPRVSSPAPAAPPSVVAAPPPRQDPAPPRPVRGRARPSQLRARLTSAPTSPTREAGAEAPTLGRNRAPVLGR